MNWAQFKDPVSHMCLAGTVVISWSLTQEVAGSSPFIVMTKIFVTEFSKFSKHLEKISLNLMIQWVDRTRIRNRKVHKIASCLSKKDIVW